MNSGTIISSNAGNIRLETNNTSIISKLDARADNDRDEDMIDAQNTWGDISITIANGAISEIGTDDNVVDIYAKELSIHTRDAIGILNQGNGNAIDTEIASLTAKVDADGGISIFDLTDITIDTITDFNVHRVLFDASTENKGDEISLSGLESGTNGAIVIRTLEGSIDVDQHITSSSHILLGATANVTQDADMISSQGSISITAAQDISQNANINAKGTIDVQGGNHITVSETFTSETQNENIRYHAGNVLTTGILMRVRVVCR
ncbi:MAG: hypothetical protein OMM_05971 [Candidatus Magnetoglobus multicellularis str. Araruama]|uniref:Uncharacterized protein n=1 Tax=Candidatus Magnetoglobus multicellularis str. Araruama TaxID=890399 RepID=A0A1V1NSU8_9BACT|nr:MAG: hypothetical protein OMM_05971 [Candidatus Magnetoglobus multicellularis str. Araruama]